MWVLCARPGLEMPSCVVFGGSLNVSTIVRLLLSCSACDTLLIASRTMGLQHTTRCGGPGRRVICCFRKPAAKFQEVTSRSVSLSLHLGLFPVPSHFALKVFSKSHTQSFAACGRQHCTMVFKKVFKKFVTDAQHH